jgi:nitrate/nitrite-specific signal transduction histidine kinase
MLLVALVLFASVYWDYMQFFYYVAYSAESISIEKYMIRLIFLIITAFLCGIFLSHKIIGPVSRLEDMIKKINSGDFDVKINLRSGDDFKGFAEQVNNLASRLKHLSQKYPGLEQDLKQEPEQEPQTESEQYPDKQPESDQE